MFLKQLVLSRGGGALLLRSFLQQQPRFGSVRTFQDISIQASHLPQKISKEDAIRLIRRIEPQFSENKFLESCMPFIESVSKSMSGNRLEELRELVCDDEIERIARPLRVFTDHELQWLRIEPRDVLYKFIPEEYRADHEKKHIHINISIYGMHSRSIGRMNLLRKFYTAHFRFRKSYNHKEALPIIARINYEKNFLTTVV